jgi:DNA-binding winged helix-turn-helix (wHTH) protein
LRETVRVRFGDFAFDDGRRELRGPSGPVPLSPKAFAALLALLERRPDAVSREDLRDRLWPKTYVADTSLRRVVAELRAALGDDESRPRFIRNVRGFGYAFCGEAEEDTGARHRAAESSITCRLEWGRREIALHEGENLLGRSDDALVVIDSASVSRRHARIVMADGKVTIEDLGSKNGTTVSGRRIYKPTELEGGDQIELGSVKMRYRVFRTRGSTETRRSRS